MNQCKEACLVPIMNYIISNQSIIYHLAVTLGISLNIQERFADLIYSTIVREEKEVWGRHSHAMQVVDSISLGVLRSQGSLEAGRWKSVYLFPSLPYCCSQKSPSTWECTPMYWLPKYWFKMCQIGSKHTMNSMISPNKCYNKWLYLHTGGL